jgi:hypothetical protein
MLCNIFLFSVLFARHSTSITDAATNPINENVVDTVGDAGRLLAAFSRIADA